MGAILPASSEATNELTSEMLVVRVSYRLVLKNLRICGPVNCSNVSEPACCAVAMMPPSFS